jgi:hypothetical protein
MSVVARSPACLTDIAPPNGVILRPGLTLPCAHGGLRRAEGSTHGRPGARCGSRTAAAATSSLDHREAPPFATLPRPGLAASPASSLGSADTGAAVGSSRPSLGMTHLSVSPDTFVQPCHPEARPHLSMSPRWASQGRRIYSRPRRGLLRKPHISRGNVVSQTTAKRRHSRRCRARASRRPRLVPSALRATVRRRVRRGRASG